MITPGRRPEFPNCTAKFPNSNRAYIFRNGIETLTGYVMPENRRALRWMRDTGAAGEWDGYNAVFRWKLNDLSAIPATPAGMDLAGRLAELSPLML